MDDFGVDLSAFRTRAADALVAFDFDGTLAPIVDHPDDAAPIEGVADDLERLAARVGEVAVVSGRPLDFLDRFFPGPSAVTLVGLYGLEMRRFGEREDHPNSGVWRETIADVAGLARLGGPTDMDLEVKGLSITLHYRRHPDAAPDIERWAAEAARTSGLHARPAKMSVELHPPIDEDKGTVLHRLVAAHTGPVLFVGDDVGDVPAFEYVRTLQADGRTAVSFVVEGEEMPAELADLADAAIDGPTGVAVMVRTLAG